jgi:hypothetical protein
VAAQLYRIKLSWHKSGIWLTHVGLVILLLGELLSGLWQKDYDLAIDQGQTKNYAESERYNELAIVDATDPRADTVVAIPEEMLARGEAIQNPALPFRVEPKAYFPNAELQMRGNVPSAPPSQATQGIGPQIAVTPLPETSKEDERNMPAAVVELAGPDGSLGSWLVSPELGAPQAFEYAGRQWKLSLRFQRRYLPFSLTLLKFSHDIYPGTDIPRNFSSRVRLAEGDPSAPSEREVLIYMNNPLRHGGLTFYQKSFANSDHTSILQVVRNPSWRLPYLACALMALGLVVQFVLHLGGFLLRRRTAQAAQA